MVAFFSSLLNFFCALLAMAFSSLIKLFLTVLSLNDYWIIMVGRYLDGKYALLGVSWEDALSGFIVSVKRSSSDNEDFPNKKMRLEDLGGSNGGGTSPVTPPPSENSDWDSDSTESTDSILEAGFWIGDFLDEWWASRAMVELAESRGVAASSSPAVDVVSASLGESSGGFLEATGSLNLGPAGQALLNCARRVLFGETGVSPSSAGETSSSSSSGMSSPEASSSSGMSSPEIFDSGHLKMVWDWGEFFFNESFENLVECGGFLELSLTPYFPIFSVLVWWFKNAWFVSLSLTISLYKLWKLWSKGGF